MWASLETLLRGWTQVHRLSERSLLGGEHGILVPKSAMRLAYPNICLARGPPLDGTRQQLRPGSHCPDWLRAVLETVDSGANPRRPHSGAPSPDLGTRSALSDWRVSRVAALHLSPAVASPRRVLPPSWSLSLDRRPQAREGQQGLVRRTGAEVWPSLACGPLAVDRSSPAGGARAHAPQSPGVSDPRGGQ